MCHGFHSLDPQWVEIISKGNWYFVWKIVLTYCEKKKCSSRLRKNVFEGREFIECLRSLEQFFRTGKGQNNV